MRVLFVQQQPDDPPGLVGERFGELGAEIEVVDPRRPLPDPRGYDLIVPLGSVDSAADDTVPYLAAEWRLLGEAVRAEVPVFGICFGGQLLCRVLGGTVERDVAGPEVGWLELDVDPGGVVEAGPWVVWHNDVMRLPADAKEVARTAVGPHAFTVGPHLGVQFHPEADAPIVRSWAAAHPSTLPELVGDPEALLAEIAAGEADARARVATLIDRVLAHAGVAAGPRGGSGDTQRP